MKVSNNSEEVQERPDPDEVSDGYGKSNKIFTFPIHWEADQCVKWCANRNYNAFVIQLLENGGIECVCAYSWRLSYFNMFGEQAEG